MKETVRRSGVSKSLRQMQQEAALSEGSDLWACSRCGCRRWRIVNSREHGGPRKRQRVCVHCEQDLPTMEIPVPEGFTVKLVPIEGDR